MKKTLLFVALLIGGFASIQASDDNKKIADPKPIYIGGDDRPVSNRPKAPSKQHIECWYCDGELSFDFVIPEGECILYLTDYATGFMTQYVFDSSDHADIYVGSLSNGGALEIHTASGHTYYGQIVIDD